MLNYYCRSPAARAHDMIEATLQKAGKHKAMLELIELSLKAKKVDFSKILAMIEGMVHSASGFSNPISDFGNRNGAFFTDVRVDNLHSTEKHNIK